MRARPFTATVDCYADITTLQLRGDLGPKSRPDLYQACVLAAGKGGQRLTIDITDVTDLDSASIGLLDNLAGRFIAAGGDAIFISPEESWCPALLAYPVDADIKIASSLEGARRLRAGS